MSERWKTYVLFTTLMLARLPGSHGQTISIAEAGILRSDDCDWDHSWIMAIGMLDGGGLIAYGKGCGGGCDTDIDIGPGYQAVSQDFFARYGAELDLEAYQQFNSNIHFQAAEVLPDGSSYFIAQVLLPPVDMDPGPEELIFDFPSSQGRLVIGRLDMDGNLLWAHLMDNASINADVNQRVLDMMDLRSDGSVVLVGEFEDEFDFDPGPGEQIRSAVIDGGSSDSGFFIWTLDSTGAYVDVTIIPDVDSGALTAVAVDADDNIRIAGEYSWAIDLDPGPDTLALSATDFATNAFVAGYSPEGDALWAVGTADATFGTARVQAIEVGGDGRTYALGQLRDAALDMDPGPGTDSLVWLDEGGFSMFVWILDEDGGYEGTWPFLCTGTYRNLEPLDICAVTDSAIAIGGGMIQSCTVDLDPGPGVALAGSGPQGVGFFGVYTFAGEPLYLDVYRPDQEEELSGHVQDIAAGATGFANTGQMDGTTPLATDDTHVFTAPGINCQATFIVVFQEDFTSGTQEGDASFDLLHCSDAEGAVFDMSGRAVATVRVVNGARTISPPLANGVYATALRCGDRLVRGRFYWSAEQQ